MDQPRLSLAREWLRKARHDLDSARKLAADPDPLLDTAIYHCQQAAEKAIKGLLVLQDQRFEKTHDLRLLVTRAAAVSPDWARLLPDAELLTPYATAFRYPDEFLEPTPEEFGDALMAAEKIHGAVVTTQPELAP